MTKGKALLSSKTFWFNLLTGIVAVAGFFGFGEFQPDPKVVEGIGILNMIGNIVLRSISNQPITKVM